MCALVSRRNAEGGEARAGQWGGNGETTTRQQRGNNEATTRQRRGNDEATTSRGEATTRQQRGNDEATAKQPRRGAYPHFRGRGNDEATAEQRGSNVTPLQLALARHAPEERPALPNSTAGDGGTQRHIARENAPTPPRPRPHAPAPANTARASHRAPP